MKKLTPHEIDAAKIQTADVQIVMLCEMVLETTSLVRRLELYRELETHIETIRAEMK